MNLHYRPGTWGFRAPHNEVMRRRSHLISVSLDRLTFNEPKAIALHQSTLPIRCTTSAIFFASISQ